MRVIEVVFENPIKRGWDKRADTSCDRRFKITKEEHRRKPAKDRIWWLYGKRETWNSENPLWKTPKQSLIDYAKKWNRKFPPHVAIQDPQEIFGVKPTQSPKSKIFGCLRRHDRTSHMHTRRNFEAPTVVQVLTSTWRDKRVGNLWEITVASGTNRMLRRSL